MNSFYFTYGTGDQPFIGGWTKVVAESKKAAVAAFRAFHPDVIDGLLNCCCVYTEEAFKKTSMYARGNFGARCHETITITLTRNKV